jgi:hypothetical protein
MDNAEVLALAIAELQQARKCARSKKVREHIDRALALINEVHHNFTT